MLSTPLLLSMFTACDGNTETPATESKSRAETPSEAVERTTRRTTSTSTASGQDGWYILSAAVQSVDGGDASADINEILERRALRQATEDRLLAQAISQLQGQLAFSCKSPEIDAAFAGFQETEASSLEANRADLLSILDRAGPTGREILWDVASPDETFHAGREAMLSNTLKNLPSWVASDPDPDREMQARRTLLALRFSIEGINMETEAGIAEFQAAIAAVDPTSDDAAQELVGGLATLDATMLHSQQQRADQLFEACARMADEYWLSTLAKGEVARFLGTIGGTAPTTADVKTAVSSTTSGPSTAAMTQVTRTGSTTGGGATGGTTGGMGGSTGATGAMGGGSTGGMGGGSTSGMGGGATGGMGGGSTSGGMGGGATGGMGGGATGGMGGGATGG
ncbi:MAG: hypothetical protein GY913_20165, partial [Proteobacteria bacterium]|nr:hypothetical protein [Pseudomonadota bacterium]